jgi:hypothetical protein
MQDFSTETGISANAFIVYCIMASFVVHTHLTCGDLSASLLAGRDRRVRRLWGLDKEDGGSILNSLVCRARLVNFPSQETSLDRLASRTR